MTYQVAFWAFGILVACANHTGALTTEGAQEEPRAREGETCFSQRIINGPIVEATCDFGLYCRKVFEQQTGTYGGSCTRIPGENEACIEVCAQPFMCIRNICKDRLP